MNFLKWLVARATEPSTHASLMGLTAVASVIFPQYAPLLQAASGVFGGLGIVLPEGGVGAGTAPGAPPAAWIPPVHIASNPALEHAINVGVQAAITDLLTPPVKK
jgi:hypothetical protein